MREAVISTPDATSRPLRIGVSSCLLGQKVRYNGGHKRDSFLTDTFGPHVEWVPVCPEVERGLVPLIVPMTLVRHHARHLDVRYLQGQTYLEPHPKELMLRNHV